MPCLYALPISSAMFFDSVFLSSCRRWKSTVLRDIKRISAILLLLKPLDNKSKISSSRVVIWLFISFDMLVSFIVALCYFTYTNLRTFRIYYKFIIWKQPPKGLKLSFSVGVGLWFSVVFFRKESVSFYHELFSNQRKVPAQPPFPLLLLYLRH